jgi:hypothetical protein
MLSGLAGVVLDRVLGVDARQRMQNAEDRWSATAIALNLAKDGMVSDLLEAAQAGLREMLGDPTTLQQVAAVAAALLVKGTLSGAEVEQIMADVVAGVP